MEKPNLNPIFFKAGIPLALSLAGFLYSKSREAKKDRHSFEQLESEEENRDPESPCSVDSISLSGDQEQPILTQPSIENTDGFRDSQIQWQNEIEEMVLKQFKDELCFNEEIVMLKNQVSSLQERVDELENLLFQYHCLKDQDYAVKELQNMLELKIAHVEFLDLKVESLEHDNRRVEVLLADYPQAKAVLESAKLKIRLLERKMKKRSRTDMHHFLRLHQQISVLQARVVEISSNNNELKQRMERIKVLEDEILELRRITVEQQNEKNEIMQRLELLETSISSTSKRKAEEDGNANELRFANKDLMTQLEQLQMDRCSDIEELIYLRRINACLKYELMKNGEETRDIISCEQEKGKELINTAEEIGGKEYDSDCSTSCEIGRFSVDAVAARDSTSAKPKFIHKLKRWVKKGKKRSKSWSDEKDIHEKWSVSEVGVEGMAAARNSYESVKSCCTIDHSSAI